MLMTAMQKPRIFIVNQTLSGTSCLYPSTALEGDLR
jgi:hypothetical protein